MRQMLKLRARAVVGQEWRRMFQPGPGGSVAVLIAFKKL